MSTGARAHRRRWAIGLLAVSLLAACGSTVPPAQRAASRIGGTSDGVESSGLTGETAASGDAGVAAAGTSGAAGSARAGSTAGGAAGATGGTTGARVVEGPGVTADKLYIGLAYTVNSSAANTAIGAAGITQGDTKKESEILIADINAHGGIAGRKVEPVWHEQDGSSPATYDVLDQQMCDDWTQDHKIFAALTSPNSESDTLQQCLHNRGVLFISDDLTTSDATRFQRYPYYMELVMMNLDRIATAQVAALKAQGWFSGWNTATGAAAPGKAKVGIVTYDGPTWERAVDRTMVPALKALGYAPAPDDIIRVAPENATADAGAIGAATSSAVLKLRGDGVTHVIFFDHAGLITLFFTRAADSQSYHPRYGLNTQSGAQALMTGAALPPNQLVGSKGIGWFPSLDLPAAQYTRNSPYSNDQRRRCLELMEAKGVTFADVNAESIAMNICTSWWFLQAAVVSGGNVLHRNAFMNGVGKLGTSFLSPGNFANRFSPTQHDGAGAYRFYGFDDRCGCMAYTGGNIPAP
jgi:hypothetical protein